MVTRHIAFSLDKVNRGLIFPTNEVLYFGFFDGGSPVLAYKKLVKEDT